MDFPCAWIALRVCNLFVVFVHRSLRALPTNAIALLKGSSLDAKKMAGPNPTSLEPRVGVLGAGRGNQATEDAVRGQFRKRSL